MKTNVYVDGFNLYYGCIRGTPWKWLDLHALACKLCPNDQINRIRYFTAKVRATASDPQKPTRQETFLRALQTIPNLSIHYGHFLSKKALMPLASPRQGAPHLVQVIRTDEKGSDVNLATYLLVDGFDQDYEQAVIISNDSDLVEPIRIVRQRLGLRVGIFNPQKHHPSNALKAVADFYTRVWPAVLKSCQFPSTLQDARGTFHKPSTW